MKKKIKYLLQLINIECNKKQDSIGKDEIAILADNNPIFERSGFKKNVSADLQTVPGYVFEDQVSLEVIERDRNSRDDSLGQRLITSNQTGVRTLSFNSRPGADYTVTARVTRL